MRTDKNNRNERLKKVKKLLDKIMTLIEDNELLELNNEIGIVKSGTRLFLWDGLDYSYYDKNN